MSYQFESQFLVMAPLTQVSAFHASSAALKKLTPPPIWVQFHRLDPLSEGAVAEFTMWFAVIPFRWKAVHSQVQPTGFVDNQESGPFKVWKHTHRFEAVSEKETRVIDQIQIQHFPGLNGLVSRLFFNRLGLKVLFLYRKWVTRFSLGS